MTKPSISQSNYDGSKGVSQEALVLKQSQYRELVAADGWVNKTTDFTEDSCSLPVSFPVNSGFF